MADADNLDAAQELLGHVDILTGKGEIELVWGDPTMTVDTAVRVATARALIDIGRSLREILSMMRSDGEARDHLGPAP